MTHTIGTVCRLLLDSRIPPRVKMDDIIGAGKIQPQAAGLEGNQEHRFRPILESLDHTLTLAQGSGAAEIEIILDARGFDLTAGHIQERSELAENQHPVPLLHNLDQLVAHQGQFAGRQAELLLDKRSRTRRLTQLRDHGKGIDGDNGRRLEFSTGLTAENFIYRHLLLGKGYGKDDFLLVRKFPGNLLLRTPENEGRDKPLQCRTHILVPGSDRSDEMAAEMLV